MQDCKSTGWPEGRRPRISSLPASWIERGARAARCGWLAAAARCREAGGGESRAGVKDAACACALRTTPCLRLGSIATSSCCGAIGVCLPGSTVCREGWPQAAAAGPRETKECLIQHEHRQATDLMEEMSKPKNSTPMTSTAMTTMFSTSVWGTTSPKPTCRRAKWAGQLYVAKPSRAAVASRQHCKGLALGIRVCIRVWALACHPTDWAVPALSPRNSRLHLQSPAAQPTVAMVDSAQ